MRRLSNPTRVAAVTRFFKAAPGGYGAGDRFLGISVPVLRQLAARVHAIPLREVSTLLQSPWHEERLLALLILVRRYARVPEDRWEVFTRYVGSLAHVNNWDLVDCSAEHILGAHLQARSRVRLHKLARSQNVWRRRIAIMATFCYVKRGEFDETFRIARMLRDDPHDLVQKAVGWMLREVGKRDRAAEEQFLRQHASRMPRTMLRYAIERFPDRLRRQYLAA